MEDLGTLVAQALSTVAILRAQSQTPGRKARLSPQLNWGEI